MHCRVCGKALAAAIDRQNVCINRVFKAWFTGVTLESAGVASTPVVPEERKLNVNQNVQK